MANGGYRPGSGRKPGYKAKVAELYSELLAKEVEKEKLPLIQALINKAKTGDIAALKEVHDRLMGKPKDNDLSNVATTLAALITTMNEQNAN